MKIEIENYIIREYYKLQNISKKICKRDDDMYKDLLHEVILQLYDKEQIKLKKYDDNSIRYYITAVMRINYYSKTSPFYYKIRRSQKIMNVDLSTCFDLEYEQESFESEILLQLVEEAYCDLDWFKKSLLDLYLSLNSSMKAVSRKTTIPISSISRYFKEIRVETKQKIISKLND
jgi:hypothetical protein